MTETTVPRLRATTDEMVPRAMVRLVLGFLVICLLLVGWARLSGRPLESTPSDAPMIAERVIFLSADSSGAAQVLDADGSLVARLDPTTGGFIAGVTRVLERERAKHGVALEGPVVLRLRDGNRLSIFDPATEWSAELMGFGASNTRAFARLLGSP